MYNYNMPQNYYGNYYNPMVNAQQRLMQLEQQYPQYNQNNNYQQNNINNMNIIQGKMVSDFETVKATDTPLDGSVSYFPLVNGEYIYTKFLNMNTGLSDYAVYKKVVENKQETENKEEFNIKEYLDIKFENLKQELLNNKEGVKNGNNKQNKPDNKSAVE